MQKKQSFITGAAVLAAASLLCKIISAVFKIPLDRFFLHEDGIAIYQSVYSLYNVFLAICVTGIPIALSGLIARADDKEASDLCFSSGVFVTVFCAICALLIFIFAAPIARHLSGGEAAPSEIAVKSIAPALLVMGIISSGRGYFQGRSNMLPSALSQIFESLMKAVIGIALCAAFIGTSVEKGAAGAIIGVTLGAFSSAIVLFVFYRKQLLPKGNFSFDKAWTVIKFSIPVTLGTFGITAVHFVDTMTVTGVLADCGYNITERLKLFGYLSRANTVYNLPATIITAITASIVPLIAAKKANDAKTLSESTMRALKLLFVVAFPCFGGLVLFAPQIFSLLYASSAHSTLLMYIGFIVLIMPYVQTTTAILQTLGNVWKPIIFFVTSILLKYALNLILIPVLGIDGAPLATIAGFTISFIFNTILLQKKASLALLPPAILKLIFCTLISCGGARLIYNIHPSVIMLGASIMIAATAYFVLIIKTGCITKAELLRKD